MGDAHPPKTSMLFGTIMIVMTLIGWSSVPLFLKHFASSIDVWTSNGWRYGFSALLWAPVLVWGAARSSLPTGLWRAAVVPSLFNAIGQTFFAWSFYVIDPALATFGLRMQIVFVSIGAYVLFASERRVIRQPMYLLGAVLVLAGTLGIMLLAPSATETVRQSIKGEPRTAAFGFMLAILAGLFFACYGLSVRHYMRGVASVTAFAAISQYTALGMVVVMLLLGAERGAQALQLAPFQLFLLLLSAVIGIALGHVFYYASLARLGVAVSSGVVQLQPFLVLSASWWLFDERMRPAQFVSGVAAIVGAGLMLSVQHRLARRDRAAAELEAASAERE